MPHGIMIWPGYCTLQPFLPSFNTANEEARRPFPLNDNNRWSVEAYFEETEVVQLCEHGDETIEGDVVN
jgi:hypothetical protein